MKTKRIFQTFLLLMVLTAFGCASGGYSYGTGVYTSGPYGYRGYPYRGYYGYYPYRYYPYSSFGYYSFQKGKKDFGRHERFKFKSRDRFRSRHKAFEKRGELRKFHGGVSKRQFRKFHGGLTKRDHAFRSYKDRGRPELGFGTGNFKRGGRN